ncbi:MAG: three-Cys-motif partner protein TcmP [Bradyrhizobium sp.]|uniref:three-Cys-motif partner protein TcmP n=1 Tax=Bradyrhizobium sp. TaxID=376 RepID=UPI00299FCA1E|nr:three-Cys-motif partner protein TcmP [Bradyrhizobium sp.]MDX3972383.1 three-Cys-motif partner protein TcmP [Bradyrhizobium sp.]
MVEKPYSWDAGAKLEEHSKRKHKVIREYLARYLAVRCQLPQQARFRFAIVDGFAGAGKYQCGSSGSPLIFIEVLREAIEAFNVRRLAGGMSQLDIECLLLLNDYDENAIELLKGNVAPLIAEAKQNATRLHLRVEYYSHPFEVAYPSMKQVLQQGRYHNVIFNLDQCGHSRVEVGTIADIIASFLSSEVFYTFGIASLLAFLEQSDPARLVRQLGPLGLGPSDLSRLEGVMNKNAWLGAAERIVFSSFQRCATYVSPFSINNPEGWRYWLIHFSNSVRARQEYNNVLHQNSSAQAHFGRSGLNMLAYDPQDEGNRLYLFDMSGRVEAKEQLFDDIPRLVSEFGDTVGVGDFYGSIYNATPAHMDDIHSAIIDNPDIEVITEQGGERRAANTIKPADTIRLKRQRSFFPLFPRR